MKNILRSLFTLALAAAPVAALAAPPPDTLIKASGQAVYYHAGGKRYVFPNEGTYYSWFTDFSGVAQVSDAEMAAIPLGGNVTYRPGIRMIKIQSDPKVYAVAQGGTLRWVTTEALAEALYGQSWNTAVDDVSDAYFTNYATGEPIDSVEDFSPASVSGAAMTINADKGMAAGPAARQADTVPANVADAWRAYALQHVNQLRQENGKPPLVMNERLNRIALIHSMDMAFNIGHLDHNGSLGETFDERIRQGKVPDVPSKTFTAVTPPAGVHASAENIGVRTTSGMTIPVEESIGVLHDAFMDEPTDQINHRTNMLGVFAPFSEIGIGVYVYKGNELWLTEDFISLQ